MATSPSSRHWLDCLAENSEMPVLDCPGSLDLDMTSLPAEHQLASNANMDVTEARASAQPNQQLEMTTVQADSTLMTVVDSSQLTEQSGLLSSPLQLNLLQYGGDLEAGVDADSTLVTVVDPQQLLDQSTMLPTPLEYNSMPPGQDLMTDVALDNPLVTVVYPQPTLEQSTLSAAPLQLNTLQIGGEASTLFSSDSEDEDDGGFVMPSLSPRREAVPEVVLVTTTGSDDVTSTTNLESVSSTNPAQIDDIILVEHQYAQQKPESPLTTKVSLLPPDVMVISQPETTPIVTSLSQPKPETPVALTSLIQKKVEIPMTVTSLAQKKPETPMTIASLAHKKAEIPVTVTSLKEDTAEVSAAVTSPKQNKAEVTVALTTPPQLKTDIPVSARTVQVKQVHPVTVTSHAQLKKDVPVSLRTAQVKPGTRISVTTPAQKSKPSSPANTPRKRSVSYYCPHQSCPQFFINIEQMKTHIKVEHAGKFTSENQPTESPSKVQKLDDSSASVIHFKCEVENCTESFKTSEELSAHVQSHESGEIHKCSLHNCEESFQTLAELREHIYSHRDKRIFTCRICEASYQFSYQLRQHMQTHDDEDDEEHDLASKKNLPHQAEAEEVEDEAMDEVHEDEPQEDNEEMPDEETTNNAGNLSDKEHSYNRPANGSATPQHVCNEPGCSETFNTKYMLKKHSMIHKGTAQSHVCPTCGKAFQFNYLLNRHKNVHNKFKCSKANCHQTFDNAALLNIHVSHHLKLGKPRGRPKSSNISKTDNSDKPVVQKPKTKAIQEAKEESDSSSSEKSEIEPEIPKRPRGRPKKIVAPGVKRDTKKPITVTNRAKTVRSVTHANVLTGKQKANKLNTKPIVLSRGRPTRRNESESKKSTDSKEKKNTKVVISTKPAKPDSQTSRGKREEEPKKPGRGRPRKEDTKKPTPKATESVKKTYGRASRAAAAPPRRGASRSVTPPGREVLSDDAGSPIRCSARATKGQWKSAGSKTNMGGVGFRVAIKQERNKPAAAKGQNESEMTPEPEAAEVSESSPSKAGRQGTKRPSSDDSSSQKTPHKIARKDPKIQTDTGKKPVAKSDGNKSVQISKKLTRNSEEPVKKSAETLRSNSPVKTGKRGRPKSNSHTLSEDDKATADNKKQPSESQQSKADKKAVKVKKPDQSKVETAPKTETVVSEKKAPVRKPVAQKTEAAPKKETVVSEKKKAPVKKPGAQKTEAAPKTETVVSEKKAPTKKPDAQKTEVASKTETVVSEKKAPVKKPDAQKTEVAPKPGVVDSVKKNVPLKLPELPKLKTTKQADAVAVNPVQLKTPGAMAKIPSRTDNIVYVKNIAPLNKPNPPMARPAPKQDAAEAMKKRIYKQPVTKTTSGRGMSCVIPFCTSYQFNKDHSKTDVHFTKFPEQESEIRQWIKILKLPTDFEVTTSTRICHLHFKKTDFEIKPGGTWHRVTGATPWIFNVK